MDSRNKLNKEVDTDNSGRFKGMDDNNKIIYGLHEYKALTLYAKIGYHTHTQGKKTIGS